MNKKEYPKIIDKLYFNYNDKKININLIDIILHYIYNIFDKNHLKNLQLTYCIPIQFSQILLSENTSNEIILIPLGHASFLILYKNKKILLDPIINKSSLFFYRYTDPISMTFLKEIDIIIYSHNHPDHFNKEDLKIIISNSPYVKIFAPSGFIQLFNSLSLDIKNLSTISWWEKIIIDEKEITLTCLPAIHWSQSNIFNRNESLWASWMITLGDTNIYFSGDTAYGEHFKTIKNNFKNIEIAIVSIAPYMPSIMQQESHLNTEESFNVFLDLGKPIFIPIHWGVFAYGQEPLKEPIENIINLFHKNNYLSHLQSTIINVPFYFKKKTNEQN